MKYRLNDWKAQQSNSNIYIYISIDDYLNMDTQNIKKKQKTFLTSLFGLVSASSLNKSDLLSIDIHYSAGLLTTSINWG